MTAAGGLEQGAGRRVEVVLVYQSLLGIYGDRGNAMVLRQRLAWRGIDAELTEVEPGDVPAAFRPVKTPYSLVDINQVFASGHGRDLHRDDIRSLLLLLVDVVVQMQKRDGRYRITEEA